MCASYKKTNSFEISGHSTAAASVEHIAIGIDKEVLIIKSNQRFKINHDNKIKDIALGEKLMILDDESVTGYSLSGDQIWKKSNYDCFTIAATNNSETFASLNQDYIEIFESSTGNKLSTVDRSRPGDNDDILIATSNGYVYSTWSFVTLVDQTGTQIFDRDLGTVVNGMGICDGTIVVSVQTGNVIGLRSQDGETKFTTELNAIQLSPVGSDELFVKTENGVHTIDNQGKSTSRPNLNNGDVYQSENGDVFCEVFDDLITKYTHQQHKIDLSVHTEEVGVGGTVNVNIKNISNEPNEVKIQATLDGCTLAPDQRTCKLDPNESKIIDFPVSNVHTEGEASFNVTVDDVVNERKTVLVEDAAIGAIGVKPELSISEINDGQAELKITISNTGDVVLDSVTIIETNDTAERIKPDESWSTHISRPYEPNRRVTVGVKVSRGDREREYAPSCSLPPLPDINISNRREVVRCEINTGEDYILTDTLIMEVPGAGRTRAPVTIENEELKLFIPQYDDGVARISFETIDVEGHVKVEGSSPFVKPSASKGGSEYSTSGTSTTKTKDNASEKNTKNKNNSRSEQEEVEINDSTENNTNTNSDIELDISRNVPDKLQSVGHRNKESILIENTGGDVDDLNIITDERGVSIGSLAKGNDLKLSRNIASGVSDMVNLNEVKVEQGGTTVCSTEEVSVKVDDSHIDFKTLISDSNNMTKVLINNNTQNECKIKAQVFENNSYGLNERISANETKTFFTEIDSDVPDSRGTQRVDYKIEFHEKNVERISTLGKVISEEINQTKHKLYDDLNIEISDRTVAGGDYPEVIVDIKNSHKQKLTGIEIKVDGDSVDDRYYEKQIVEELGPDETINHEIDLEATGDTVKLNMKIEFTYRGTDHELKYILSGKTVLNEKDWSDDLIETWSIGQADDTDKDEIKLPDILSTSFSK
jgi:hypothetical protein